MKYLVYNTLEEAQLRADIILEDMGGADEFTTKYCDIVKHAASDLWAVPVDMRLQQYFTSNEIDSAVILTYDWFPIINEEPTIGYKRINTKGTVIISSIPGILRKLIIGMPGNSGNKIIIYDNITNSGTVIQQLLTTDNIEYSFNVKYNIGLTISNTLGTSADFTVYYE